MAHLLKRGDHYYFNRRVPDYVRSLDNRNVIRVALRTDNRAQARHKAAILNKEVEDYWASLITDHLPHDDIKFKRVIAVARQMGFGYQPMAAVANLPLNELAERLLSVVGANSRQVAAVLGGYDEHTLRLSQVLDKFWEFSKERILNKSRDQERKWRNPRIKAINNFIAVVGDKDIACLTRDDVIKFKNWWLSRIKNDQMSTETANKDFIHVKNVLETVVENLRIQIDIKSLFKKIVLKDRFATKRLPLTNEQIIGILESDKLDALNSEAKAFLMVAAETGARPAEILGLLPEDIHLECAVPYISIKDRPGRPLKTPHSERDIPLVGYALTALRAMRQGFSRYRDNPDSLSSYLNAFLREKNLLPSEQHSVYSLRHSFQDRLTSVNAPERIQCELMGHKFSRPKYGSGGSLSLKSEWMAKISLNLGG